MVRGKQLVRRYIQLCCVVVVGNITAYDYLITSLTAENNDDEGRQVFDSHQTLENAKVSRPR